MARRPEDLQTHPLTADFEDGFQLDLPLYAREAGDFEPTFKHPKLNGYRALVLALTSGLGIPKAVLMFRHRNNHADSTAVTSLDLAFNVVCATGLYWLGLYEESHPPWMRRWLFNAEARTHPWVGYEWHHPRLTIYRIVVLALTIAFGTWKAALTYTGQSTTVTPNMLDWQFGVIGIIWLFWLGWFEECHPEGMHWIFAEDKKEQAVPQRFPGFTAYRILAIVAIASFGISKAVLESNGKSVEANWIDLVLGVVCTSGLFWLGLYQRNCPESWRWFFIKEYFSALSVVPAGIFVLMLTTWPFIFFIYAINHYIVVRWLEFQGPLSIIFTYIFILPCVVVIMAVIVALVVLGKAFVSFVGFLFRRVGTVRSEN